MKHYDIFHQQLKLIFILKGVVLQPTLYDVQKYRCTHTYTRFGSLHLPFLQVRQCFHSSTIPTSSKLLPLFLTKKAFQLLRHKTTISTDDHFVARISSAFLRPIILETAQICQSFVYILCYSNPLSL